MNRSKSRSWIAIVTASLAVLAPQGAWASGDDCAPACQKVKSKAAHTSDHVTSDHQVDGDTYHGSQMSWGMVLDQCGPPPATNSSAPAGAMSVTAPQAGPSNAPAPRSGDVAPPSYHSGDPQWDNCFALLTAEWAQVAPDCAAIDAANSAHDSDMVSAIAYTAAFVSCGIACIVGKTGFGSFMEGVCAIAGGVGAVYDIIGITQLDSGGVHDGWNYVGAVGGSAAALTAATMTVLQTLTNTVSTNSTSRAASCSATAVFGVEAIIKWANLHTFDDTANAACDDIKKLGDTPFAASYTPTSLAMGPTGGGGSGSPVGRGNMGGNTKGSGGSNGFAGSVPAFFSDPNADLSHFPPPGLAATAGNEPAMKLFNTMPNIKGQMPEALQALGTNLHDFAKAVASQGPAGAVAGMGGVPDEFKTAAAKVDEVTHEEMKKHAELGGGSTMSAGGGGAKGKTEAKKNPFGLFGMQGPAAPTAPGTAEFNKEKKKDVSDGSESSDIWHEGYAGTIFQIVSHKLVKERDKVDQLEWATPLNRALAGLPNKPGSKLVQPAPANNVTNGGGK